MKTIWKIVGSVSAALALVIMIAGAVIGFEARYESATSHESDVATVKSTHAIDVAGIQKNIDAMIKDISFERRQRRAQDLFYALLKIGAIPKGRGCVSCKGVGRGCEYIRADYYRMKFKELMPRHCAAHQ